MAVELNITIKDEERKLTKDFLIYEEFSMMDTDPVIAQCIKDVKNEFKGEPEDVIVKAKMVLK